MKFKGLQGTFSAGVLSPEAMGRVDIARYPHAAKKLRNIICRTLGGAQKRFGTQYLAPIKNAATKARLIPFVVSSELSYMLEFGDGYFRVFKSDGTQVTGPYELPIIHPIAETLVLDYAQNEEAMLFFHNNRFPWRLRYFSETHWDTSLVPFDILPYAEIGYYPAATLTFSSNTVGVGRTATASVSIFLLSDVGRAIVLNAGLAVITGYTSGTVVTVEIKSVFDAITIPGGFGAWQIDSSPQTTCTPSASSPVGATITLTLPAGGDGWRTLDVGKLVKLNGGLVKITAYTSALVVSARIIKELSGTVAAPALAWSLEDAVWNVIYGYPATGTFYQQRLVAASTLKNTQTIWASKTGDILDFTIGTIDSDGFSYTIGGDDAETKNIKYLIAAKRLLALAKGGEFSIYGGIEKPLTPTNIQIDPSSKHGSATVRPVQANKETLFVQRAGKKLIATGALSAEDSYQAADITTLANTITESGIASMAFQQEPEPIVWIALNSGRLVSVTLDRTLEVIAWSDHETDGAVESVAVLPSGTEEQVWLIIRRSVNGAFVRYVERMKSSWYPVYGTAAPSLDVFPPGDYPVDWGFTLDCAITGDDAVGKTVWDAQHLKGKTVRCLADGVDMPAMVVDAGTGQVTLPRAAKRVLIGLMYKPTIIMLTPEVQTGTGSMQADAISMNEAVVRVHNTIGLSVNGDQVLPGRIIGPDQLDLAPALFTGDKSISTLGWAKGKAEVTITQDDPFPFHLLAVIRGISSNTG
jgi:hypothetical protein